METVVVPPPPRPDSSAPWLSGRPAPASLAPASSPAARDDSLLPRLLSAPVAFLWFWVLPIAVLFALNWQGYTLIEGNMNAVERARAAGLGVANLVNLAAGIALYGTARRRTRAPRNATVDLVLRTAPAIAIQIGYLWLALSIDVVPRDVAAWIFSRDRLVFNQLSFAMLPLAIAALQLACMRLGRDAGKALAINLAMAIGAPLMLFALMHTARASDGLRNLPGVIVATFVIGCGLTMFLGVVRCLMHGLRAARRGGAVARQCIVVGVALVLPLGGLALNRAIPFPVDFQAWEVYALVGLNALALLVATATRLRYPRAKLALLGASLPFSLYFFVVFLPYTPLAVLAVVVFGAGFLVLAPTLLFALHLFLLNEARREVARRHSRRHVLGLAVASLAVLPAVFVGRATRDKVALDAALEHVFTPAIHARDLVFPHRVPELRRALRSHRDYKHGLHYPLLSDFYAWWVFDHLVLSDEKLERLEHTFFGEAGSSDHPGAALDRNPLPRRGSVRERTRVRPAVPPPRDVKVETLRLATRAADADNTIATFALTLHNRASANGEFLARLPLPAGVFVSGFRLHIDGVAVPGRIFEKKTALWVYTMIRDTERRDPGLLFHRSPDELELRVFPIAAGGKAVVEIDFLAPGDFAASDLPAGNDPAVVLAEIGRRRSAELTLDARGSTFVANGGAGSALPAVEREPYVHVLIDRSREHAFEGDLGRALREVQRRLPAAREARVTLVHHDVVDLVGELTPLTNLSARDFGELARRLPAAGGCSLDAALARAIRRHRDDDLDRASSASRPPPRPIFVVLSRDAPARTLELERASEWLDLVPAFELHELSAGGAWRTHRAAETTATPLVRLGTSMRPLHPTRAARFASRDNAHVVSHWSPAAGTWAAVPDVRIQKPETAWSRAASLHARHHEHVRSPGGAGLDLAGLVRLSRESGVLLPTSSYIVVENAAQWRMLERSERRKLTQNTALEFVETPAPPSLAVAAGFALWLGARAWRGRHRRAASRVAM